MKGIIVISFLVCFSCTLRASHLMGGNLGYEYLGLQANGKYRYKVKLTTYVDCGPTSEIPYAEYPLKIGVYSNDMLDPGADKPVVDSLLLTIDDTIVYIPFLPPGCNVGENSCIIQARYSGYIDLPASVNGYYLFYERCCRNAAILNLQPDGSNAFLAYIPPTAIVNNSPDFLYPPIPFLCVNDTHVIFNTATDIDGDSLVYEFTTPFNGFGGSWDPMPDLPAPTITWPVFPVSYVSGFSTTEPFAFFGEATIDGSNGVSTYISSLQGTFVVCVVVKEYRNGILISQTYRDLQLLFNNCPNNFAPELVDNLQHDYEVEQGDTLCFPISFLDFENDSVFIDANGDIFDAAIMDTPAVFFITDIDSNRATGNFCWDIPCTIDTGIYEFYMHSVDNGCPPKDKYEFYTIKIVPPEPPELFGADTACKGTDSVLYWLMVDEHFQYNWNVNGGVVMQNYGDSIVVSWGAADSGKINVDIYTASGCYISSDSLLITLMDVPELLAMPGDTVCINDTLLLTAIGTVSYYWYPETALVNPIEGNAEAVINNSGWFYVAGLPGELCPPSDSVYITALPLPILNAGTDNDMVCAGDTILLFAEGAVVYHWTPTSSVFEPGSANTYALSDQNEIYIITGTDSNQCTNTDTVVVNVYDISVFTLSAIGQICTGDTATITASGGISYQWFPPGMISPDTGSTVSVFPGVNTTYLLEITDSNGCKRDTSFEIMAIAPPDALFTYDTLQINCEGTWIQFNNMSTGANGSHWILGNGNTSDEVDPLVVYPFGGTYIVQLITSSLVNCNSTFIDTIYTDDLVNLAIIQPVNVFTPNDDGTNDLLDFHLPVEFTGCSHVYIYDRWGVLMFESTQSNLYWNGKFNNKQVPEGVYYWMIDLKGEIFNGFVQIFK